MSREFESVGNFRFRRGVASVVRGALFPLFSFWSATLESLQSPERLERGLVIVLPGIDGRSALSLGMVEGLDDSGLPYAIVMKDWTTGVWPLFLYHLRAGNRQRRHARLIAHDVISYQREYPHRPVFIVGHSAGAAMAIRVLEQLPESSSVEAAVLLAAAVAPQYALTSVLRRVKRGLWSYSSWLDLLFVGAGTTIFGTVDARLCHASGWCGFQVPQSLDQEGRELYANKLHQVRYSFSMLTQFHTGGHFSCVNRVFIAEHVAPLLRVD